jgi:hypothetical protein
MAHKAIKQMQGGRKRKTDGGVRALIRLVAGCVPTPRALEGMNELRRKGIEGNVTRRVRKLQEHIRYMCAVRERRTRVQHAMRRMAVDKRAEEARTRRAVIVETGKKETKKRRKEERAAKEETKKRKREEEVETKLKWERGIEREEGEVRQERNERQQKRAREKEERAQMDKRKQESEGESDEEERGDEGDEEESDEETSEAETGENGENEHLGRAGEDERSRGTDTGKEDKKKKEVKRVRKKARYETCARMEMRAKVVIEESWDTWKTDRTVEASRLRLILQKGTFDLPLTLVDPDRLYDRFRTRGFH